MKIIVVDDSRAVHAFVEEIFSESRAELRHFYDAKDFVDALAIRKIEGDLVLLNWEMPQMNGIDALPIICSQTDIPVMMMTSKSALSDIAEAMSRGAIDYVMKPFTKEILLDKVGQVFGQKVA
jgi:two-component system, chemotaxis family, chemotaxis protein CheY